jgi:hypothetical protein
METSFLLEGGPPAQFIVRGAPRRHLVDAALGVRHEAPRFYTQAEALAYASNPRWELPVARIRNAHRAAVVACICVYETSPAQT